MSVIVGVFVILKYLDALKKGHFISTYINLFFILINKILKPW